MPQFVGILNDGDDLHVRSALATHERSENSCVRLKPADPRHVWSCDSVFDASEDGRRQSLQRPMQPRPLPLPPCRTNVHPGTKIGDTSIDELRNVGVAVPTSAPIPLVLTPRRASAYVSVTDWHQRIFRTPALHLQRP